MVIVDVQEAARQLGVSPRRVRKILADKLVPGVRICRAWAIEQQHLDRFKEHRAPIGRPWSPSSARKGPPGGCRSPRGAGSTPRLLRTPFGIASPCERAESDPLGGERRS